MNALSSLLSSGALGFSGCIALLSPVPKTRTFLDLGTLQLPSSPGATRPTRMGIKTRDAHGVAKPGELERLGTAAPNESKAFPLSLSSKSNQPITH